MPAPNDALQADAARTRMGRWKMLFVLLICASPVVASYWTYYVIRPEGRRNYGELIEPQRPLPAVATLSLSGEAAPLTALKGQWLLLSVGGGACDAACQQRLYFQRQLRETLGKDKDRLDRVWLIQDDAAVAPTLMPAVAQATVLKVKAQDLQAW
jgi:cytochrome oxidase Cu insertion factor (SCO1/SenC/PrrC family)